MRFPQGIHRIAAELLRKLDAPLWLLATMVTDRRFARFSKGERPLQTKEIPEGGMCLSIFIVLSKPGRRDWVLLGRLDPKAPWDHIGALDPARVEQHRKGWMLPSCHLMLGEAPLDGVQRVLAEQLGLSDQILDGPKVFSEVYGPSNHWDIEFVFTGERDHVDAHSAWKELAFVDLNGVRNEEMARSHEDILAHLGRWKSR